MSYFLYFWIKIDLKNIASEWLAKTIVTFHKNESKEVLKHTVNDFQKNKMFWSEQFIILLQNIVNVIEQVISQKSARPKKNISDWKLQTLDNKANVSQRHLARRFGLSQSTISRHLKKRTSVGIHKRRSAPKCKNEDQQQRAKSNCLKLYK